MQADVEEAELASQPGPAEIVAPVEEGRPPPEAELQEDGSHILVLPDGSTCRWTQRQDGSWRKPERKRVGWIGDLEANSAARRYVPPPLGRTQCNERDSKHELHRPWRLWLRQVATSAAPAQASGKWADELELVHEFDTAEDFWCMTHFSHPPSHFSNLDISLFESGVTPAWEDPRFKRGGRWVLKLDKIQSDCLDDLWVLVNMALIGEAFTEICGELVRGATVSRRRPGRDHGHRSTKIALWLERGQDQEIVMAIGREYQRVLSESARLRNQDVVQLSFEDFQKQRITLHLGPAQSANGPSCGAFQ